MFNLKTPLLLLFLIIGGINQSWAIFGFWEGDIEKARELFDAGDYVASIEEYKLLSENDNANGQYGLSLIYFNGEIIEKNLNEAFRLMKLAATKFSKVDQNELDKKFPILNHSMEMLGYFYAQGVGTEKNLHESYNWNKKAADNGSAYAIRTLINMYYFGEGVDQNYKKAFEYSKILVSLEDNKDPETFLDLGRLYLRGEGTEVNMGEGFKWVKLAADKGSSEASYMLWSMYFYGEGTEQSDSNGIKYLQFAADNDYVESYRALGAHYYEGIGVEKNLDKSFNWFEKSAKSGDILSIEFVAKMYAQGIGVSKNESQALQWLARKDCIELGLKIDAPEMVNCAIKFVEIKMSEINRNQEKAAAQKQLEIQKKRLIAEQKAIEIEKKRLATEKYQAWIARQNQLRTIANDSFTMGAALLGY